MGTVVPGTRTPRSLVRPTFLSLSILLPRSLAFSLARTHSHVRDPIFISFVLSDPCNHLTTCLTKRIIKKRLVQIRRVGEREIVDDAVVDIDDDDDDDNGNGVDDAGSTEFWHDVKRIRRQQRNPRTRFVVFRKRTTASVM